MSSYDATTIEYMVEALLRKDRNTFNYYFTDDSCDSNVDPAVRSRAEEIFKEIYPDKEFDEFLKEWKRNKLNNVSAEDVETFSQSRICNKLTFDPSKREMISVLGPRQKKSRSTEFDVFEFLKTRQEIGCPIRFQSDVELEADLEVLMEPQKGTVIDAGLRKIARALTVLNSSCSYRLLDVHSERVVR